MYLREVYIKFEKQGVNVSKIKEMLYIKSNELLKDKRFSGLRLVFDVDPV